ncbi:MAG: penicillin-binding protein activator LpoB [Treponema sp.]|jgi:hypothetical protein|nr:penicillin-binding protein activator LpoB [Treponema sp.]
MKIYFSKIFVLIAAFTMFACAISRESTIAAAGMDLEAAVREAAQQMEARLPSGTEVALVSLGSPSSAFSENVLNRLESAIVGSGKLIVVDRSHLDQIRWEQGFQLSAEVDDNSAKSIGRLIGAGAIVTGSFADLGDAYSLTIKAINIETGTVAVSYTTDLYKTMRIETLLARKDGAGGSVRTAPPQTPQEGNRIGGITAQPPAAAGPPDGTYTFNPRIQAFQGARAVSVYLDRIVVRRGYMTVYIFNRPEGDGDGYGSSLMGTWKSASLIDMDNNRSARLAQAVPGGPPFGSVSRYDLTYQNVTGMRLTLTSDDTPPIEFYDIVLEQPDR